jgi:hypothetical protein
LRITGGTKKTSGCASTRAKKEQFWYYGELECLRSDARRDPLVTEFARVVKELKDLDEAG